LEIEIFTGPNCAYCMAAKKLLEERCQAYVEKDITDEAVMAEFRERLPRQKSLPQIFIDGEHIGGHEDLRLRMK
jgi:glutaredoxin 3